MSAPTFGAFSTRWLDQAAALVRATTARNYRWALHGHLLPRFRDRPLDSLARREILTLVPELIAGGLAPGSARLVVTVLRAILSAAVDEEILPRNPASNFGRRLRGVLELRTRPVAKSMTPAQMRRFLAAAHDVTPQLWCCYLFIARTGVRISEALGLTWEAVDLDSRIALIAESWHSRDVSERDEWRTKTTGSVRMVDLSAQLVLALRAHRLQNASTAWVFVSPRGRPWHRGWVEDRFKVALAEAGLPLHLSPHSLRHSHASTLLRRGEPLQYVSRALGHSTPTLTLALYGSHLPNSRLSAVDGLDDES